MSLTKKPEQKDHLLKALSRYWPKNRELVEQLPVHPIDIRSTNNYVSLVSICLPDWATECGVDGYILVPEESAKDGVDWRKVDWWLAAFLMLECWHERCWEKQHGPIHSFSFRLQGWDPRLWERAWVNRIALFLRSWAAQVAGKNSEFLFGALPKANIVVTHDVDAIKKTFPIRLKQGGFNLYNAFRLILRGDTHSAFDKFKAFLKFTLGNEDWWTLEWLLELEKREGIKAHFNFYADHRPKTLKRWLMDPWYSLDSKKMQSFFEAIKQANATIGLHPTYDAWESSQLLMAQKHHLENKAKCEVKSCRQHWLRFAWDKTWSAQSDAGLKQDTTLMFNDRPGFRASAALSWKPWNSSQLHTINEMPTVLMDSQFYDYQTLNSSERKASLECWVDEVKAVRGEAAVLWHPHTLTNDYSWQEGFGALLRAIKRK